VRRSRVSAGGVASWNPLERDRRWERLEHWRSNGFTLPWRLRRMHANTSGVPGNPAIPNPAIPTTGSLRSSNGRSLPLAGWHRPAATAAATALLTARGYERRGQRSHIRADRVAWAAVGVRQR
jgi:hypothetical protein